MEYLSHGLSFIHGVLAPGPTTPLFMPGGALQSLNEDLTQIIRSILFFMLVDYGCVKHVIKPKARYFALHVMCDALVCLCTYQGVVRALDPLTFLTGPTEVIGNNLIAGLHLYHCLAFNLSADDIFHHLTFVSTLCVMAIGVKHNSGINVTFAGFFLSGLPGGVDYLMLTLVAHGKVSKDLQKNVYTKLNLYMRGPAMCLYAFFWWTA